MNYDHMTRELWLKLINCIYVNINSPLQANLARYTYTAESFEYDGNSNHSFNGIIRHLINKSDNNITKEVDITSSTKYSSSYSAHLVTDLDNQNFFLTADPNAENAFLMYDFKERRVHPTHYTIRSRFDGDTGYHHPKNWVIEASNDKNQWKIIDQRDDVTLLQMRNSVATFEIQVPLALNEKFKYLRIRQNGKNVTGDFYFCFSALEYFGTLFENSS